eukprot:TRINITY_DN4602_c1_g1_i3.p1 TRINITY_DN4602_c1_g1~~TRINITY_DN4602_c1_g1_i3.p1  ORF type:complete len:174 (+),score=31.71 TRINITY_DN4602_c1_g1_i3:36-557(+)
MSLTNYKFWLDGSDDPLKLTDASAGDLIARESGFLQEYTTAVDALKVLADPTAAMAAQKAAADRIHEAEGKAAKETADFLYSRGWTPEEASRAALQRHGKRAREDIVLQSMARPLINNLDLLIDAGIGRSVGSQAINKLAGGVPALEASKATPGQAVTQSTSAGKQKSKVKTP